MHEEITAQDTSKFKKLTSYIKGHHHQMAQDLQSTEKKGAVPTCRGTKSRVTEQPQKQRAPEHRQTASLDTGREHEPVILGSTPRENGFHK